ncbi:unnamed protein product [Gordionus sp. m RMFG-2023]
MVTASLLLDGNTNIALIRNDLSAKGKFIKKKDIYNLKYKLYKNIVPNDSNDLNIIIKAMQDDNINNIIEIYKEDNTFKGLYFQTPAMKEIFARFPELLLIDVTYKLNNFSLPVFTLYVVDGEESTRFAGVWIVASENYNNIFNMCGFFKINNNNHNKIQIILSGTDVAGHQAYKDAFPGVEIEICLFHVFQSFRREITIKKRNILDVQVKPILKILKKMVYASTLARYTKFYRRFESMQVEEVLEYYNKNWHPIREEFCLAWRPRKNNFNILTNNRTEVMRRVFKMVNYSSLCDLFKRLKIIIDSSEQESIHKIMMNDKKKSFNKIEMDSSEYLYEKLLTTAGFEKIETQLILSKTTKLTNYISANYYDCTCGYKSRLQIPCEHILKLRKVSDIPLFDEKLVGQRWHKEYNIQPYLKNEFIFDNNKNIDKILDDFIPPISETSQKVSTQRKTFKQSKMIADQIEKDIFPTLPNPTFNEDFEIQRS